MSGCPGHSSPLSVCMRWGSVARRHALRGTQRYKELEPMRRSRRAVALAVIIQFVQVAFRGAPGCPKFSGIVFGCTTVFNGVLHTVWCISVCFRWSEIRSPCFPRYFLGAYFNGDLCEVKRVRMSDLRRRRMQRSDSGSTISSSCLQTVERRPLDFAFTLIGMAAEKRSPVHAGSRVRTERRRRPRDAAARHGERSRWHLLLK